MCPGWLRSSRSTGGREHTCRWAGRTKTNRGNLSFFLGGKSPSDGQIGNQIQGSASNYLLCTGRVQMPSSSSGHEPGLGRNWADSVLPDPHQHLPLCQDFGSALKALVLKMESLVVVDSSTGYRVCLTRLGDAAESHCSDPMKAEFFVSRSVVHSLSLNKRQSNNRRSLSLMLTNPFQPKRL